MENTEWLFRLREDIPHFLKILKGKNTPGFFHYSLSGDLYDEDIEWGLGNTVFAAKVYYTLDLMDNLSRENKTAMADFIKSFQGEDGTICDTLVRRKALLREKLSAIRNFDFNNFFHKQTATAETRQAISALKLLGTYPRIEYQDVPRTEVEIKKYLEALDWTKPWGAGSHFSHLLLFLQDSRLNNKEDLTDYAIKWADGLCNPRDGGWYKGNPSLQQKINGAMKMITGFKVADKVSFRHPELLIDLCLSARSQEHACDNFNVMYVLHYASKASRCDYRNREIRRFALEKLKAYKNYYFPDIGGFSFLPNKANIYYYGAKVSKGLKEPDIHGTCMFLWGISIIAHILQIDEKLGFNELIP
jgi:hypothetical protein